MLGSDNVYWTDFTLYGKIGDRDYENRNAFSSTLHKNLQRQ